MLDQLVLMAKQEPRGRSDYQVFQERVDQKEVDQDWLGQLEVCENKEHQDVLDKRETKETKERRDHEDVQELPESKDPPDQRENVDSQDHKWVLKSL